MTAVQNKSMSLVPRVCPLCGSSRITSVLIDEDIQMAALTGLSFASRKAPEGMHYRMAICGSCDVAYANPAPDIQWLHDQYVNADFDAVSESRDAAQNHGRLIQPLLGRLPDIDRALDIGAGDGFFSFEMEKMGNLKDKMPITYITFMIGSLSLVGIFPFAGFWSKDDIINTAYHGTNLASTIVHCLTEPFKILRQGAISLKELNHICKIQK